MDTFKSFPKPVKLVESRYEKALRYKANALKKPKKTPQKKKRVLLIPINKLLKKADTVFSKWIRNRDRYLCFARDIPGEAELCKGYIQCCHLIKRSFKPTRFDETNCHAGCKHHNYNHDHGFNARPEVMTGWFIKNYGGLPYLDLKDKSRLYHKWTREELLEIIKKYDIQSPKR